MNKYYFFYNTISAPQGFLVIQMMMSVLGGLCEQSGLLRRRTDSGGRHWSGTQTRSLVEDQRGKKRNQNYQTQKERGVICITYQIQREGSVICIKRSSLL